jgi:hypothetical protein
LTWQDVFIALPTFAAAVLVSNAAHSVGAVVYLVFLAGFGAIPIIGPIYRTIVHRVLQASFLFRLASWVIGASGLLIFIEIIRRMAPAALEERGVLAGLLLGTTVVALSVLHRVHLMEVFDANIFADFAERRVPGMNGRTFTARLRNQVLHAGFADQAVRGFFTIAASFGTTLYLGDRLGLFATTGVVTTPLQGFFAALASIQINLTDQAVPKGPWAVAARGFYSISLLVYSAFYLAIAPNLIAAARVTGAKGETTSANFIKPPPTSPTPDLGVDPSPDGT